jgi:hypothetical protein
MVRKKLRDLIVRFQTLIVEYGIIAIFVHYVIFAVVIVGLWAAIRSGWQPTSMAASMGTWGAAYVAAKITQPFRIVATLALTPIVARLYERVTGRRRQPPETTAANSASAGPNASADSKERERIAH